MGNTEQCALQRRNRQILLPPTRQSPIQVNQQREIRERPRHFQESARRKQRGAR